MNPAAADLQALLAARHVLRQRGDPDLVEVGADLLFGHRCLLSQEPARTTAKSPAGSVHQASTRSSSLVNRSRRNFELISTRSHSPASKASSSSSRSTTTA